ncbi:NUDIX hydrolase [Shewanella donghaensis]|uniref:NUDIX hydrolase n=1 Tax=Shewanella donghaensis TaxID=238836 RepID=UPI0011839703|nr:NUDIX hydrolase [Shewanella donghaensis]
MDVPENHENTHFSGCKLALIFHDQLVVYLRDDKSTIPFPNKWDFAGGGREGIESAEECVLRELHEEFDIALSADRLIYKQGGLNQTSNGLSYFFAAHIHQHEIDAINFGSEGQYWQLMPIETYLEHPDGIVPLQQKLTDFLAFNDHTVSSNNEG